MQKVAVIDLGTNTFHLLIAGITESGDIKIFKRRQIPVKLGENGFDKNHIPEKALARAISAIEEISEDLRTVPPDKTLAYATSAFRTTSNNKDLVGFIEESLNTKVNIIEGHKEAELIYYGVRWAVNMDEKPCLILDIGGGSVEFIIANNEEIFLTESIEIGAARLLNKFHRKDPIGRDEIEQLNQFLEENLTPVLEKISSYDPKILVGASGAFETITEIELRHIAQQKIDELPVFNKITRESFEKIASKLIASTRDELFQIKGMAAFRVNMIVVAVLLIRFLMDRLEFEEIWFSDYAIKEGILWEAHQAAKHKNSH